MTDETRMIIEEINGLGQRLDKKIDDIQQSLGKKINDIQLTLENETNRNIRIIAEAHLDLSRKLDEALKVENEKESLIMRVNRLENEVRQIKEKMDDIA